MILTISTRTDDSAGRKRCFWGVLFVCLPSLGDRSAVLGLILTTCNNSRNMFGRRKAAQPKGQGAAVAKQVTKTVPAKY